MPLNTKISKFLSLVLRHKPDAIGLNLTEDGWANITELVEKAAKSGLNLPIALIHHVVATNDKQRFSISPDGLWIRANQGHSVPVDLGLKPQVPPERLYHGTARRNLASIKAEGIKRSARQFVHLSIDAQKAVQVGKRHGNPIVLEVQAGEMQKDGFKFYCSENGIWLTEWVPTSYLIETETRENYE